MNLQQSLLLCEYEQCVLTYPAQSTRTRAMRELG